MSPHLSACVTSLFAACQVYKIISRFLPCFSFANEGLRLQHNEFRFGSTGAQQHPASISQSAQGALTNEFELFGLCLCAMKILGFPGLCFGGAESRSFRPGAILCPFACIESVWIGRLQLGEGVHCRTIEISRWKLTATSCRGPKGLGLVAVVGDQHCNVSDKSVTQECSSRVADKSAMQ